ncbi:hypothetical protein [Modestobacter versicolor]|uniref:Uncharacterized protein n=1 Tax=Modestobacter versicolor TaxID=429133 RepID=A0A323VC74_9ACTN|nr:hypothetical protein [Modestobacter versicolor]PZA21800.1 hypothetical protein DMO24_08375 [Modestobacter versicolor]
MWELAGIAVAFLAVSVGVAALARRTTARWERERERRAGRARRRAVTAPPVGARGRREGHRPGAALPRLARHLAQRTSSRPPGRSGAQRPGGGVDPPD